MGWAVADKKCRLFLGIPRCFRPSADTRRPRRRRDGTDSSRTRVLNRTSCCYQAHAFIARTRVVRTVSPRPARPRTGEHDAVGEGFGGGRFRRRLQQKPRFYFFEEAPSLFSPRRGRARRASACCFGVYLSTRSAVLRAAADRENGAQAQARASLFLRCARSFGISGERARCWQSRHRGAAPPHHPGRRGRGRGPRFTWGGSFLDSQPAWLRTGGFV